MKYNKKAFLKYRVALGKGFVNDVVKLRSDEIIVCSMRDFKDPFVDFDSFKVLTQYNNVYNSRKWAANAKDNAMFIGINQLDEVRILVHKELIESKDLLHIVSKYIIQEFAGKTTGISIIVKDKTSINLRFRVDVNYTATDSLHVTSIIQDAMKSYNNKTPLPSGTDFVKNTFKTSLLDDDYCAMEMGDGGGGIATIKNIDNWSKLSEDCKSFIYDNEPNDVAGEEKLSFDESEKVDIRRILRYTESEFKELFKSEPELYEHAVRILKDSLGDSFDLKDLKVFVRFLNTANERAKHNNIKRRINRIIKTMDRIRVTYLITPDDYDHTKAPHERSGHWRHMKSGLKVWVNKCKIHKEKMAS